MTSARGRKRKATIEQADTATETIQPPKRIRGKKPVSVPISDGGEPDGIADM